MRFVRYDIRSLYGRPSAEVLGDEEEIHWNREVDVNEIK